MSAMRATWIDDEGHPKATGLRRRGWRARGKAVLGCVLAALLAAPTAAVATTDPSAAADAARAAVADVVEHTVTMGAVDPGLADPTPRPPATPGRLDRFEYLAYYPDVLQLHRGDTVRFRRDGFHTATFSPPGENRSGWLRRDEVEPISAVNGMAPSQPLCGGPDQEPCMLASAESFLSSGWVDMRVTVDLEPGTYDYYCELHPGMSGQLQVVPDDEPVASPAEVEAQRQAQVARDTAAGEALMAAGQTPEFEVVGDHVRWTVKAGDTTADGRVSVLRFLPGNLEVAPGDEVDIAVPPAADARPGVEIAAEPHTVTFPNDPSAQAAGFLRYLNPACDPDAAGSGLPGLPGAYPAAVAGCPAGTTLEMLLQPWAWRAPLRAPDDAVVSPATVHDSGVLARAGAACRTACDPWTGERFPSSSRAVFPAEGTFGYVCLMHPEWGMAGSVTVTGGSK